MDPVLLESSSLSSSSAPTSTISTTTGSYVIHLANLSSHFAAAASAPSNAIAVFDKSTLNQLQTLTGHSIATTSLQTVSSISISAYEVLISSGKDGSVKVWDGRSNAHSVQFHNPGDSRGILCCDVSPDGYTVVAGTELEGDDSLLLYWDTRNSSVPIRKHTSTHSEDITSVKFAPQSTGARVLLSASVDGLICTSNPDENDEDESVYHVGNWGCSISQAGWLDSAEPRIWASSDMETFSTWSEELDQRLSLDIRGPSVHTQHRTWVTDYLISSLPSPVAPSKLSVFVGSNEGDVALITNTDLSSPGGAWCLQKLWTHGHSGIVRSLIWDEANAILVTGGEDSNINIWPSIL